MKRYRNILLIVLAFFAGAFSILATGLAFAHGGDTRLIHGCVRNNGLLAGFIRIVGANTNCAGNETALDWNAQGLPGTGALVANLHGANINNTDFGWRTLKNADFSGAGCSLSHDTFNHTDLTNVNFTDCNFNSSNFINVDFTNITLGNNDFTGASISNSNLSNKNLTNANLDNISIGGSNLTNVNMSNITFGNVAITNSNLTGTNFTGANFSSGNADLSGVTGTNTNFTNANLQGVSFSGATLTSPIWSNTTCPDGTNSNSNGNTCVGHGL